MLLRNILLLLFIVFVKSSFGQSAINTVYPNSSDYIFSEEVTFRWNSSLLKLSSNKYQLDISNDSLQNSIVYTNSSLDINTDTVTIAATGVYFFKVSLLENGAIISSSESVKFTRSDIRSLTDLSLLLIADSGLTKINGSQVSRWENLVDTSTSPIQSDQTKQATHVNSVNELNNNGVIRFDGVDDYMTIFSSVRLADVRVLTRWSNSATFFPRGVGLITTGGPTDFIIKPFFSFTTTSFQASSRFPTIKINAVVNTDFSPLNEFKIVRAQSGFGNNFGNTFIGIDRLLAGRMWDGDVAEIIGFSEPISDSINTIVNSYLCKKYSTPLELGEDVSIPYGFCDTLFTVSSSYDSYLWSNGDTTNSSVLAPGQSYKLTVTNKFGCEFIDKIGVFSTSINTPKNQLLCLGDTFVFNTNLSNQNYSFLWNNSSTDSSIKITQQDDYYVTVTDTNGCFITSDTVQIRYDSTLFGIDLGNDTSLCSGNEIGLISPLTGIDNYQWSSGSTDSIAVVTSSQKYYVTVSKSGCSNTDSINILIKGTSPNVNFGFDNICFGDTVRFRDSTVDPMSISLINYNWSFGDSTSSSLVNPSHFFAAPGLYNVRLSVENDSNCLGIKQQSIVIRETPTSNFNIPSACENNTVQFNSASISTDGLIVDYLWDFGVAISNIDTSSLTNPEFKFPKDSTFEVSLNVTTNFGCSDSISKDINVNSSPNGSFTFTGNTIEDSTRFTDLSSINKGNIISYTWDFGNGLFSNQKSPAVKYTTKGKYNVSIAIISDSNCIDVFSDSIKITDPPPVFNTVYPKNNQVVSEVVQFRWNAKEGADSYQVEMAKDSLFLSLIGTQKSADLNMTFTFDSAVDTLFWRVKSLEKNIITDTSNISRCFLFNISNVDSVNLWLRADQGVVIQNGFVSDWLDQSDSALQIAQPNINRRPTLINNELNNLPVVNFDNSDDQFVIPLLLANSSFSIFSIYNVAETNRNIGLIRGSNSYVFGVLNGKHSILYGGVSAGKSVISNKFVSHSIFSEADSVSNFVNNIFYGKKNNTYVPGFLTIGSTAINGNIAEVIIVNGEISEQERSLIDLSLMNKYAPIIDLGKDRYVCSLPDSIDLTNDYITNYHWSTGDTTSKVFFTEEGRYYLTVTDEFERTYTDSINIVLDTTNYRVDFGFNDTTICLGNILELNAGRANYDYLWNTMQNSPTITIASAGVIKVSVRNCLGNLTSDSVEVKVNNPSFTLGNDTTFCHNQIISILPDSNFQNVSYRWSNGEIAGFILADTTAEYSLTVTDSFGCSFRDSIRIVIDSSLFGTTLGPDTSLCVGNRIRVKNNLNAINQFSWSTNSSSNFTLVDTSGQYKVTVSNAKCSQSDTVLITIKGDAPTAQFSFSNLCLNDSVAFLDSSAVVSVVDTIVSWLWDFGNGDTSNQSNPNYKYGARNNYQVSLKVETQKGCTDTITEQLEIEPLPKANFSFQNFVICAGARIFHQDSSQISRGFIQSYNWTFNDPVRNTQNTSSFKNPFNSYDSAGFYNVKLNVVSDKGCLDSIQKPIFVNPTPIPNYILSGFCIGDSISLYQQTTFSGSNALDYFWTIRLLGSTFTTDFRENPILKFDLSGQYDIGLRARNTISTGNYCEANFKDTITLFDNPQANFNVPQICEEDSFRIVNTSIPNQGIVFNNYVFNNRDTFSLENPKIVAGSAGLYPLTLIVTDTNNCVDSITKTIEISPKPEVKFSILNNNSGIPFKVDIENNSENASRYLWSFGNGDTSINEVPDYSYIDTGSYQIKLIGTSSLGCTDSSSQIVYALKNFIDAHLTKLFLRENDLSDIEVSFQILNSGFNTINDLQVIVDLNNDFEFREQYEVKLYSGETEGFTMDATFIPDAGKKIDFVCVRIFKVNGVEDSIQTNNELCELGFNQELSIELYPNPVQDFLSVQYTLPDDGSVQIEFFDALGRKRKNGFNKSQEEGYYSVMFDFTNFESGMYLYRFVYNGVEKTGKFLVYD